MAKDHWAILRVYRQQYQKSIEKKILPALFSNFMNISFNPKTQ